MMEEQAAAEASHSVYTKPVALYNILRQRAVTNPLFLQRCLHYKLQAKLDKRIQISVSTSGATTTNDGLQIQTLFPLYVLLARPVSTTNVETQSTAVYRFNRARKLTVFGGAETATFILPEMNKLLKQIKSGSLEMLLVSCADSSNSQNIDLTEDHMLSNLLNGMDYCLFGKIPMDSLHSSWEKTPPLSLGGRSEMKSDVNMKPCSMKLSSIGREKCLSFQFPYNSEAVIPVDIFTEECRPKDIFQPDAYSFKDTHGPGSMRLGSGNVIFNYTYWNTALYRTEVTKDFSCPFCLVKCSNMKGLKCHLISSHDLFEFVFYVYEDNQGVIVYAKSDANSSEFFLTIPDGVDPKQQLFSYCHKSRRRRKPKWQTPNANNVHLLVLDSTMSTALTGHIDNTDAVPDNMEIDVCSPDASATCPSLAGPEPVQSVPESNLAPPTMRQSDSRNRALLEKRQFFHSRSGQPMDLEQVLADHDSEDEAEDALENDRRMLDDFVDVSKDEKQMMLLWNSFVRKQRVLADGHIPWACEAFSKLHGPDLVQAPSVLWCWNLFMIKLWDHGLLDSTTMNNCSVILEQFKNQSQSQSQKSKPDH